MIKATLGTLVIILIIVIVSSYYINKEGFDDISNGYMSNLSQDLSAAVNTVSSDASSAINTVSSDTSSALNSASTALNGSTMPIRNDVVPQVSISGSGYDAMNLQQRAELLKDIQKVVRNEILIGRNTTPVITGSGSGTSTDSTSQGQEYESSCHKDTDYRCPKNPDGSCPPLPDMSQYIKKDEIPCWNCRSPSGCGSSSSTSGTETF